MKEFIYSNDQLKDKASRPSLDHNKLNHIFLNSQKRKTDDLDYPKSKKYFTKTDFKTSVLNKGSCSN